MVETRERLRPRGPQPVPVNVTSETEASDADGESGADDLEPLSPDPRPRACTRRLVNDRLDQAYGPRASAWLDVMCGALRADDREERAHAAAWLAAKGPPPDLVRRLEQNGTVVRLFGSVFRAARKACEEGQASTATLIADALQALCSISSGMASDGPLTAGGGEFARVSVLAGRLLAPGWPGPVREACLRLLDELLNSDRAMAAELEAAPSSALCPLLVACVDPRFSESRECILALRVLSRLACDEGAAKTLAVARPSAGGPALLRRADAVLAELLAPREPGKPAIDGLHVDVVHGCVVLLANLSESPAVARRMAAFQSARRLQTVMALHPRLDELAKRGKGCGFDSCMNELAEHALQWAANLARHGVELEESLRTPAMAFASLFLSQDLAVSGPRLGLLAAALRAVCAFVQPALCTPHFVRGTLRKLGRILHSKTVKDGDADQASLAIGWLARIMLASNSLDPSSWSRLPAALVAAIRCRDKAQAGYRAVVEAVESIARTRKIEMIRLLQEEVEDLNFDSCVSLLHAAAEGGDEIARRALDAIEGRPAPADAAADDSSLDEGSDKDGAERGEDKDDVEMVSPSAMAPEGSPVLLLEDDEGDAQPVATSAPRTNSQPSMGGYGDSGGSPRRRRRPRKDSSSSASPRSSDSSGPSEERPQKRQRPGGVAGLHKHRGKRRRRLRRLKESSSSGTSSEDSASDQSSADSDGSATSRPRPERPRRVRSKAAAGVGTVGASSPPSAEVLSLMGAHLSRREYARWMEYVRSGGDPHNKDWRAELPDVSRPPSPNAGGAAAGEAAGDGPGRASPIQAAPPSIPVPPPVDSSRGPAPSVSVNAPRGQFEYDQPLAKDEHQAKWTAAFGVKRQADQAKDKGAEGKLQAVHLYVEACIRFLEVFYWLECSAAHSRSQDGLIDDATMITSAEKYSAAAELFAVAARSAMSLQPPDERLAILCRKGEAMVRMRTAALYRQTGRPEAARHHVISAKQAWEQASAGFMQVLNRGSSARTRSLTDFRLDALLRNYEVVHPLDALKQMRAIIPRLREQPQPAAEAAEDAASSGRVSQQLSGFGTEAEAGANAAEVKEHIKSCKAGEETAAAEVASAFESSSRAASSSDADRPHAAASLPSSPQREHAVSFSSGATKTSGDDATGIAQGASQQSSGVEGETGANAAEAIEHAGPSEVGKETALSEVNVAPADLPSVVEDSSRAASSSDADRPQAAAVAASPSVPQPEHAVASSSSVVDQVEPAEGNLPASMSPSGEEVAALVQARPTPEIIDLDEEDESPTLDLDSSFEEVTVESGSVATGAPSRASGASASGVGVASPPSKEHSTGSGSDPAQANAEPAASTCSIEEITIESGTVASRTSASPQANPLAEREPAAPLPRQFDYDPPLSEDEMRSMRIKAAEMQQRAHSMIKNPKRKQEGNRMYIEAALVYLEHSYWKECAWHARGEDLGDVHQVVSGYNFAASLFASRASVGETDPSLAALCWKAAAAVCARMGALWWRARKPERSVQEEEAAQEAWKKAEEALAGRPSAELSSLLREYGTVHPLDAVQDIARCLPYASAGHRLATAGPSRASSSAAPPSSLAAAASPSTSPTPAASTSPPLLPAALRPQFGFDRPLPEGDITGIHREAVVSSLVASVVLKRGKEVLGVRLHINAGLKFFELAYWQECAGFAAADGSGDGFDTASAVRSYGKSATCMRKARSAAKPLRPAACRASASAFCLKAEAAAFARAASLRHDHEKDRALRRACARLEELGSSAWDKAAFFTRHSDQVSGPLSPADARVRSLLHNYRSIHPLDALKQLHDVRPLLLNEATAPAAAPRRPRPAPSGPHQPVASPQPTTSPKPSPSAPPQPAALSYPAAAPQPFLSTPPQPAAAAATAAPAAASSSAPSPSPRARRPQFEYGPPPSHEDLRTMRERALDKQRRAVELMKAGRELGAVQAHCEACLWYYGIAYAKECMEHAQRTGRGQVPIAPGSSAADEYASVALHFGDAARVVFKLKHPNFRLVCVLLLKAQAAAGMRASIGYMQLGRLALGYRERQEATGAWSKANTALGPLLSNAAAMDPAVRALIVPLLADYETIHPVDAIEQLRDAFPRLLEAPLPVGPPQPATARPGAVSVGPASSRQAAVPPQLAAQPAAARQAAAPPQTAAGPAAQPASARQAAVPPQTAPRPAAQPATRGQPAVPPQARADATPVQPQPVQRAAVGEAAAAVPHPPAAPVPSQATAGVANYLIAGHHRAAAMVHAANEAYIAGNKSETIRRYCDAGIKFFALGLGWEQSMFIQHRRKLDNVSLYYSASASAFVNAVQVARSLDPPHSRIIAFCSKAQGAGLVRCAAFCSQALSSPTSGVDSEAVKKRLQDATISMTLLSLNKDLAEQSRADVHLAAFLHDFRSIGPKQALQQMCKVLPGLLDAELNRRERSAGEAAAASAAARGASLIAQLPNPAPPATASAAPPLQGAVLPSGLGSMATRHPSPAQSSPTAPAAGPSSPGQARLKPASGARPAGGAPCPAPAPTVAPLFSAGLDPSAALAAVLAGVGWPPASAPPSPALQPAAAMGAPSSAPPPPPVVPAPAPPCVKRAAPDDGEELEPLRQRPRTAVQPSSSSPPPPPASAASSALGGASGSPAAATAATSDPSSPSDDIFEPSPPAPWTAAAAAAAAAPSAAPPMSVPWPTAISTPAPGEMGAVGTLKREWRPEHILRFVLDAQPDLSESDADALSAAQLSGSRLVIWAHKATREGRTLAAAIAERVPGLSADGAEALNYELSRLVDGYFGGSGESWPGLARFRELDY